MRVTFGAGWRVSPSARRRDGATAAGVGHARSRRARVGLAYNHDRRRLVRHWPLRELPGGLREKNKGP